VPRSATPDRGSGTAAGRRDSRPDHDPVRGDCAGAEVREEERGREGEVKEHDEQGRGADEQQQGDHGDQEEGRHGRAHAGSPPAPCFRCLHRPKSKWIAIHNPTWRTGDV
jgi:hypothetical protein